MKIYNKEIIKALQQAINKNNFTMVTYKDYDFMKPYIQLAELKLQLCENYESTGMREVIIHIDNYEIKSEYIKEWRKTAQGKFVIRDFKYDHRDFIGNTLYHEVSYANENNVKYNALVRLLNEITEAGLSEEDKNEYIKSYGDIKIDNKYFSVIKIYPNDDRHNLESKDSIKLLDNPVTSHIEETSSIIEGNDILPNNKNDDEDEPLNLDPLF